MRQVNRNFCSRLWLLAARVWWCLLGAVAGHGAAADTVVVTDDRGAQLRFDQPPSRIVTLLPSLTETLCELGGCSRLVGTDRFSNWPAVVQALPKLGGLEDTQVERLFALKPDLVLVSKSARVIERLETLGLRVMAVESNNLSDTRRVAQALSQVLGQPEAGPALMARIDSRILAAAARIPAPWRGARVYFEVSSAPYAAGESSFVGEVISRLGLGHAVPAGLGPFPKLNPEFIVRAKPDLVMASRDNAKGMAQRPGWNTLQALSLGHVCAFSPVQNDILVRPGPRLAEAAEIIADCVAALPPRQGLPK
jgi:iron complex transport system substrate-binding protein